ncbi:hypothetical protein F1599_20235 [Cupriavidus cauae]|uniref:Uncharacterized protein n=1 Tax=Cupriavidus cauae TaxID=2608999 RepID=A0A5M8A764_9BURK|nr:hypothetical protein F1599_20235 [Cupriavidus cauae]
MAPGDGRGDGRGDGGGDGRGDGPGDGRGDSKEMDQGWARRWTGQSGPGSPACPPAGVQPSLPSALSIRST